MFRIASALALVASAAVGTAQSGPEKVDVGSRPKYSFANPLINGQGLRSLADLRGRPVVIEFWGTH
jgi:hypothetical protein